MTSEIVSQEIDEDECASCFHGVSNHRFVPDALDLAEECIVPGYDCTEFIEIEEPE